MAVVGDRCVTQMQTALGQFVVCMRTSDGTTLWEQACGTPYEAIGIYPGPRATPTIAGNRVYYATPEGQIGCLDLNTGQRLWSREIVTDFEQQGIGFGYAASPLVMANRVILPCGGKGRGVLALDANTGQAAWTTSDEPASYSPIVPIHLDGELLLVAYLQNAVAIIAPRGKVLWQQRLSTGYDEHSSIPVYSEPFLVLSAPFKAGADAYELRWKVSEAGERSLNVTAAWSCQQFSNDVNSCVARDGLLFGFDLRDPQSKAHRPSRGEFRCLDIHSGEILWSSSEIGQAGIIAVANNRLVLFNDAGQLLLADVSRDGCTIRSKADVFPGEVCWTRPVLSDGRLYLRGSSRLVCLKLGPHLDQSTADDNPVRRLADLPKFKVAAWHWLLNGEREHPFMPPDWSELWKWYLAGLVCALLPGMLLARLWYSSKSTEKHRQMTCACQLTIGCALVSTPLLNRFQDQFVFTWPAGLFAALQGTLLASQRLALEPKNRTHYWQARFWGFAWLLLSFGYFWTLRRSSLPLEWVFLVGYLPALPVSVWTARQALQPGRSWSMTLGIVGGYSVLFWGAVGFDALRLIRFRF